KGFAISTRGRPTIFKPEAPSKVKGRVVEHLEDTFSKLDLLHEVLRAKGEPQLVYTIVTKPRVLEKIGELIDQSAETCIVATPTFSEIRENLGKKIEQAIARGIRFTIITEPGQKIPEGASSVHRKGRIATVVIGAGPAGGYFAGKVAAAGYEVALVEEHREIGEPIQCGGLVTPRVFEYVHCKETIIGAVHGAELFSPSGRKLVIDGHQTEAV